MTTKSAPEHGLPPAQQKAFYRPKGYAPEDSVGYLMRMILTSVAQEVERRLEPAGLTNAQWMPLFKLYMGKASTVAELARESNMDAGAMTRLLDRLEAKELVRRVRNAEDRRVVNIELTDSGVEAAKVIPSILCDVQNTSLTGFNTEEWQTLKGYLRRILANTTALAQAQPVPGEKNAK